MILMVEIKMRPMITCDDVRELTGENPMDFEFAQMAEDGSYQIVRCDDDALAEMEEEIEWELGKWGNLSPADFEDEEEYKWHQRRCPAYRLMRQKKLVEILRERYNIKDSILVYVCW